MVTNTRKVQLTGCACPLRLGVILGMLFLLELLILTITIKPKVVHNCVMYAT